MQIIEAYPNLRRAALLIARDNGMINREYTEEQFLRSLDPILGADGVDDSNLRLFDVWLGNITTDEMETLTTGEHTEQAAVLATAPSPEFAEKLDGLLNDIFDKGGM